MASQAMDHRDRFAGRFDAVLAAAQRGDSRAVGELYSTLSPVVVGYLRLQGSHEPEDLTSEVFVGVLRNLASFSGDEAGFRSWLFTIAYRRLLDERRRLVRRPPAECATTLGKTLGAVKALQRRGFASIVRRLEQEGVSL